MGKRLVAALGGAGLMLGLAPSSSAASNTATTLLPVDEATQLETHIVVDCHRATGSCDFTAGADLRTPDGVTGFPPDLWSRQSTEIRSTDRLAYLDVHANGQFERVMKSGGSDVITTVYFGDGPPEKYQTSGRIDSTDWRTGQPKTDVNVIACTHIQVVYAGVNLTSPSTCAQTGFS
ncbi:hypothetical protein JMUB5695_00465 [Mycobacterium heckeshornense]|uniref:hypothetical protein n=1 Tax=Mycobacterium heckeshornense TaxID=110505 RepID=UPI001943519F|nr:hypothetical protein [Mycobacterium heckeshornense]BCQ07049.1 hypothetical protein JMUB5695_00465 [Mycobacterium heckeshornense]